jgi:hypothetical protein
MFCWWIIQDKVDRVCSLNTALACTHYIQNPELGKGNPQATVCLHPAGKKLQFFNSYLIHDVCYPLDV